MADSQSSNQRGVYRKYNVTRTDGSSATGRKHADCAYFVLDLDHDPHARAALKAYADSCRADYPKLVADLDSNVKWCAFGGEPLGELPVETTADDTEDMANIGRALMARRPKDYHWNDCPTEIVTDLQNEIHDLKRAPEEPACHHLPGQAEWCSKCKQPMLHHMSNRAGTIVNQCPDVIEVNEDGSPLNGEAPR